MDRIDQLTADDFTVYLEKHFRPAGTDLTLTLAAVNRHQFPGWEAASRQPFSLILRGPPHPVLPEGPHRVAIADGPMLLLYIIPILTAGSDHQDYQIVFN